MIIHAKIDEVDNKLVHKSDNGKLLLQVIQNQDLQVLNFHSKCIGKWTHVIRTTGAASVLDYIMTSENLTNKLQEITIDEDCLFCPFWVKKKKQQFSDHNAIIPKFRIKYRKLKKIHRPGHFGITLYLHHFLLELVSRGESTLCACERGGTNVFKIH